MKEEVYSFQYCGCIYESAFATISLHRTKKGAYNSMRNYIEKDYAEWRDNGCRYGKQYFKHGVHEDWRIVAIPIDE